METVVLLLLCTVAVVEQAAGSCEDRCGATYDPIQPCQCNSMCIIYGDCCQDYQSLCVEATCSLRCYASVDNSKPCQCNTHCETFGDCCNDYYTLCRDGDTESLSDIMEQIWNLDSNRVSIYDYVVSYQTQVSSGNTDDRAANPFFTYLNENVFNTRETFARFLPLLDNYNPNVGQTESVTAEEWAEIESFLDVLLPTPVMQKAYAYLRDEGKTTDEADFRDVIKELWFNLYPRSSSGPTDSSGFEHVMVGEINNGVSGFHSWIQFYLEEKSLALDYMGHVSRGDPEIVGAQFRWNGHRKGKGSFFVASSPEFDFAVYSICALMHPNSQCSFTMNGNNIRIQTWDINHKSGMQIGSAYPIV